MVQKGRNMQRTRNYTVVLEGKLTLFIYQRLIYIHIYFFAQSITSFTRQLFLSLTNPPMFDALYDESKQSGFYVEGMWVSTPFRPSASHSKYRNKHPPYIFYIRSVMTWNVMVKSSSPLQGNILVKRDPLNM